MEERIVGGRYKLTEKIGNGGMAVVYKAQDQVLGRTVAVKLMREQYASDPNFAARFRQEAQAAANLQSPYIVNIYDWGQEGSTYYIAMEYVRGIDLRTAIDERGSIDPRKVAEIAAQVCAGLAVAHGYDIIHRDIKPHNIMVQPDGTAKIMDFGIARAGNTSMTQTGSVLGTAHYVSPEQAQGLPLTPATDIYSLGVVMYEAATGKLPFDAPEAVAVALKQVNEQPIPPRQINPNIAPALEAIILKAMAKKPENRFSSANEMRSALNAYLSGNDAVAQKTAVLGGAAAAGAAGAAMADQTSVMPTVPGTVPSWDDDDRLVSSSRGTGPSKKGKKKWPWIVLAVVLVALVGLGVAWGMGAFSSDMVAVPKLEGLTQDVAETTLVDKGLELGKVDNQPSDDVPKGTVISSDPEEGIEVKKGTKVDLVVSAGKEMAEVPDVVGLDDKEAFDAIKAAGFDPQRGPDDPSDTVEEGKVISQDPPGKTQAVKGSEVTYTVSKGSKLVEVPNVKGKNQSQATTSLQNAGFKISVNEDFSDTVEKGLVISQDPSAGAMVKSGTTVAVTISKGPKPPETIPVPNVIGLSEAAAVSKLQSVGLKADVQYQMKNDTGNVIDQNPREKISVNRGTSVTIYVDKDPAAPTS